MRAYLSVALCRQAAVEPRSKIGAVQVSEGRHGSGQWPAAGIEEASTGIIEGVERAAMDHPVPIPRLHACKCESQYLFAVGLNEGAPLLLAVLSVPSCRLRRDARATVL